MTVLRSMRALRAFVCAAALLQAGGAWAHAHLQKQAPAANSLQEAPEQIRLEFSEPLEGALSRIEVVNASGAVISAARTSLDPASPKVLLLPLTALPAGSYTVNWNVVSVDGHRTRGSYRFTVK